MHSKISKIIFDKTASFAGLVFLSPVFAVIAVVIKIKMPGGPVFFRQKRIGQFGKTFEILKFRTREEKEESSPRLTPLGSALSRYKLNELPQLWNILKGDMSFVGPRPDVPGYADKLQGDDRIILELKPGLTCPATLKYRNEEELLSRQDDPLKYNDEVIWPDKVKLNKEYAKNASFFRDLKIILQTLGILKA